ncbi:hypothetical protein F5H01DRAFT_402023 [Linnemannia elongata]|nr:hypothetical protein F5H01DRAFT_402023 [Linnemannia elongata]
MLLGLLPSPCRCLSSNARYMEMNREKIKSDDINIFFSQPNPNRRGSSKQAALLQVALSLSSPIYTIVQAANCRDHLMKLNITTVVFMFIYGHIFSRAKDRLEIELLGHDFAIPEGGSWRMFGIVVVALFCLLILSSKYISEGELYVMIGSSALMFTVVYPTFLAIFVTILVKDHGQWIPRPSTVVEYVMLVTRCVAGFGGIDVLGATVGKIYRRVDPEVEECPDVEPGFNWHSVRVDPDFFTEVYSKVNGFENNLLVL